MNKNDSKTKSQDQASKAGENEKVSNTPSTQEAEAQTPEPAPQQAQVAPAPSQAPVQAQTPQTPVQTPAQPVSHPNNTGKIIACGCCGCLFVFVLGLVILYFAFGGFLGIQSAMATLMRGF